MNNNNKTGQLKIPNNRDKLRACIYRCLKKPYLVAACLGYLVIIGMVLLYLQQSPTYSSEMDLVLPGTGASSNVNLNEVGEVVSQKIGRAHV